MEIYTKDDELPDDIAEAGDERIPISDLPVEDLIELADSGLDIGELHSREQDSAAT